MSSTLSALMVVAILMTLVQTQADDDKVDIKSISMFPQDYSHDIYSGYLTLS